MKQSDSFLPPPLWCAFPPPLRAHRKDLTTTFISERARAWSARRDELHNEALVRKQLTADELLILDKPAFFFSEKIMTTDTCLLTHARTHIRKSVWRHDKNMFAGSFIINLTFERCQTSSSEMFF